jgi:hypothetical protein
MASGIARPASRHLVFLSPGFKLDKLELKPAPAYRRGTSHESTHFIDKH